MKLNEVVKSFLNSTKKSSDSSIVHPYKVSVDLTNNDFYSLTKYTTDSYLAIGFSAANIVYADKYTQLMAPTNCINKGKSKSVLEYKNGLNASSDPKSVTSISLNPPSIPITKSSKGLSINCF